MTRRPTCRWCGSAAGELVPVAADPGALAGMTTSRRAAVARLARLQPVVEHTACLEAEEEATAAMRAAAADRYDRARAAIARRDVAEAMRLTDEAADLTVAQFRKTQPERTTKP